MGINLGRDQVRGVEAAVGGGYHVVVGSRQAPQAAYVRKARVEGGLRGLSSEHWRSGEKGQWNYTE